MFNGADYQAARDKGVSVTCWIDAGVAVVVEIWKSGKMQQRVHNNSALFIYANVNKIMKFMARIGYFRYTRFGEFCCEGEALHHR